MKTKNNTVALIVTSVLCLLPLIFSFAVYDQLPEQITVQWDSAGNPSNIVSKAFAAIGLPLFFFAVNMLSKMFLFNDPKRTGNLPGTLQAISVWTPPLLSLIIIPVTLSMAMGADIPIHRFAPTFVGFIFIIFGNYMPKIRQNYTSGIRLPWTLHNADNWNRTHRFGGYLWILGGVALIAAGFALGDANLWGFPMILYVLAVFLAAPIVYSFALYRKTDRDTNKSDE